MDYQHYFSSVPDWESRPIWVCGLDVVSLGVIRFLEQCGHPVQGILDDGFSAPVWLGGNSIWPADHIKNVPTDTLFVITAFRRKKQQQYREQIMSRFGEQSFIILSNATEIRVEASGQCNLRCPSCQVANHGDPDFPYNDRDFMQPSRMEEILDKIDRELPQAPAIYLFSLGEPLLNRNLPELIRQIHTHGYLSVVSSNLSLKADLEALVDSGPDIFKISVSGFSQDIYETTHARGNIELVKENMHTLSSLIRERNARILVTVGYHIYNNNDGEELESMRLLCEKLGFLFLPVEAMFFNMLKRTGYYPFSDGDREFIRHFYSDPASILTVPEPDGSPSGICRNMRDKLFLDYDGTVQLCELFHHEAFYKSFLDVSIEEIRTWRYNHWICRRCMAYGMHLKE